MRPQNFETIGSRHLAHIPGEAPHDGESGGLLATAFAAMGVAMPFKADARIFGADEPADYVYMVVRGAVRVCELLEDGRRQINAFYLPGDLFGLEAGKCHQLNAEAVVSSRVRLVRRSVLEAAAACDCALAQALWTATAGSLRQAHHHIMLLGRKSATERVASFLLQMSMRTATDMIELPMSRQDIADYLGLTIETVSRALTRLRQNSAILIPSNRRIVLSNRAGLQRLDS